MYKIYMFNISILIGEKKFIHDGICRNINACFTDDINASDYIFIMASETLSPQWNNNNALLEKGGITAERMVEFIDKNIKGKYKKQLIIMDNGGAHKSKK